MKWILFLILITGCISSNETNEVNEMINANGIFEWIFTDPADIELTVNAGTNSVSMGLTGASANFQSSAGLELFVAGEQVLILQTIFIYPLQFCQGDLTSPLRMSLEYETFGGLFNNIAQLGDQGVVQIPTPNTAYDTPANIINTADQNGDLWRLRTNLVTGTVSMVNVPASLDGLSFPVIIGLAIRHNTPMS